MTQKVRVLTLSTKRRSVKEPIELNNLSYLYYSSIGILFAQSVPPRRSVKV